MRVVISETVGRLVLSGPVFSPFDVLESVTEGLYTREAFS
jgi:hypothetical protein